MSPYDGPYEIKPKKDEIKHFFYIYIYTYLYKIFESGFRINNGCYILIINYFSNFSRIQKIFYEVGSFGRYLSTFTNLLLKEPS